MKQPHMAHNADGSGTLTVAAQDAAEWAWLLEAPVGWLHLLNVMAREMLERYGAEEPTDDEVDARLAAAMPVFQQYYEELKADDPEFAAWVGSPECKAWQARRPAHLRT